jgi:RimJ/RimL family protein N-acetyltransferase
MKYVRKISGELCYLSPMVVDDYPVYTRWLNDPETVRYLNLSTLQISYESEREALQELAKGHNYAVVDLKSDQLIGNCGLVDWDQIHGTAEAGIFIGNRDFWGKGYGAEALYLLTDFAFNTLNIKSILLKVYSANERAISCYRKIGYKQIGRWRSSLERDRQRSDLILMDCVPGELVRP